MNIIRLLVGVSVFLGAFLLFQVQPLIAKAILPYFGGTSAVWITCMLFFQVMLLAGYGYAHAVVRWLNPKERSRLHCVLLGASLLLLPIIPAESWRPNGTEWAPGRILLLLGAVVGLPYLVLASTSPLMQAEYARRLGGGLPYRFFALSNLASMLALLTYPTVFEPLFDNDVQAVVWSAAYVLYAGTVALFMLLPSREESHPAVASAAPAGETVAIRAKVVWVFAPACASVLLLTSTAFLSENVAAVPMLWILPLTAYLASFIICFDKPSWYRRELFIPLALAAIAALILLNRGSVSRYELPAATAAVCIAVFLFSMYCHGETILRRPPASGLTEFYLMIAAGGALGGVVVGLLSPMLLPLPLDFPISILLCCGLMAAFEFGRSGWVDVSLALAVGVVLVSTVVHVGAERNRGTIYARNFYGTVRVYDSASGSPPVQSRSLMHGVILHGLQLTGAHGRSKPTSYFAPGSGIEVAISRRKGPGPLRVGVIGLGVGTIAAYGRRNDVYRFYEINPEIIRIARENFSFLSDSAATVEVVLGDARLSLERERQQDYDVLAVDAFSGDSIPAHLLTSEAMELYKRHVRPGGILAIHISNRVLDLEPVVSNALSASGMTSVLVRAQLDYSSARAASEWVLASMDPNTVAGLGTPTRGRRDLRVWTDQYSNLWATIR